MSEDATLRDPHLPVLIVTGTRHDGESLVLDTQGFEKVLGSGPDCHLRLEGGNIDFHHARVLWDERGVVLTDDGSSTGTYVNGERIGADHPLEDGDRICLGPPGSRQSVKLLVRVPPEIAEAQTVVFGAPESAPAPNQAVTFEDEPALTPPVVMHPPAPPTPPAPAFFAPEPEPIVLDPEPAPVFEPPPPAFVPPPAPAWKAQEDVFVAKDEPALTLPVSAPPPRAPEPPPPPPPPRAPAVAPPPPPPPVRAAAPPPLPSIGERPRPKPDYAPDLPSIAHERAIVDEDEVQPVAEAPQKPKLHRLGKRKAPAPPAPSGGRPRLVLLAGVGIVLVAAAAGGVWFMGHGTAPTPAPGGPGEAAPVGSGPRISGLEPDVALPGNEVVLIGTNVGGQGATVEVSGVSAPVRESTIGRVRFQVPKLPIVVEGQSVPVVVKAGGASSKPFDLYLGRLPLVSEASPRGGPPGERVVVKGRGFDPQPGGNRVSFGDDAALILGATATELTVIVPAPRSSLNRADVPVLVRRGGRTSGDSVIFNITRPSEGTYRLKFFGAAVDSDERGEHAFVSTEVGPLLLLSGAGSAATVGARAAAVAAALNALVGKDVKFEARGTSVAAAGATDTIVDVTPADVAGYAKPLDPVMAGQQGNAGTIAGYWAALLQDTFVLLGKGERPSRVLELTTRGKVLMDLYSESERRVGSGNGVPAGLVSPPTWTIAKAFREMALALPTRGGAVAAAAVAGRWEGTMTEAGQPPRSLRLELRLDGPKLLGTMSTNAGGLTMDSPLNDVTYVNGVLSFTLVGGSTPRRVTGKVAGARLDGTIQGAPGQPAGRVSLRYLE